MRRIEKGGGGKESQGNKYRLRRSPKAEITSIEKYYRKQVQVK